MGIVFAVFIACGIIGILDAIWCDPGAFFAGLFVVSLVVITLLACTHISWWCLIPGITIFAMVTS